MRPVLSSDAVSDPVPGDSGLTVLLVGGYGRSGSTIVDLMLSRVPGFSVIGEVRHLFGRVLDDDELCNCGIPVASCSFWRTLFERAFPDGVDRDAFDEARRRVNRMVVLPAIVFPALRTQAFQRHLDAYRSSMTAVYRAFGHMNGSTVVLDSSKYPVHLYALLHPPPAGIEMKVMLLVREPRAVAHSWETPKIRPEIHWEQRLMPRHHALRSALAWLVSNALVESLGRRVPLRIQRYEDLPPDPVGEIASIVRFATGRSTEISDDIFDVAAMTDYHKVAGNPLGLSTDRLQVVDRARWRAELAPWKQRAVRLLCAPLMRRYGYE